MDLVIDLRVWNHQTPMGKALRMKRFFRTPQIIPPNIYWRMPSSPLGPGHQGGKAPGNASNAVRVEVTCEVIRQNPWNPLVNTKIAGRSWDWWMFITPKYGVTDFDLSKFIISRWQLNQKQQSGPKVRLKYRSGSCSKPYSRWLSWNECQVGGRKSDAKHPPSPWALQTHVLSTRYGGRWCK